MKNRICPYHNLCLSYGDCDDCDHGINYTRLQKKIKSIKKKVDAPQYLIVEANNYNYNIAVIASYASRKKAVEGVKQRYQTLLKLNGFEEDGNLCYYSENGYNVSDGNNVVYGSILEAKL